MKLALLALLLLAAAEAAAQAPLRKLPPPKKESAKSAAPAPKERAQARAKAAEEPLSAPSLEAENYNYFHLLATETMRDSVASAENPSAKASPDGGREAALPNSKEGAAPLAAPARKKK